MKRGEKYPVEILTQDECRTILRTFGRGPTAIRNRALVVTFWRGGLRCSESLNLDIQDVDVNHNTVRIRHGKGNESRTAAIDPEGMAVIEVWLSIRKKYAGRKKCLFCTLDGNRLQPQYVRAMVHRIAKRAGIEKRVHPHAFRHTYAVELMREGYNLEVIQRGLGHREAHTTSKYLDHLEPERLIKAIASRPSWNA